MYRVTVRFRVKCGRRKLYEGTLTVIGNCDRRQMYRVTVSVRGTAVEGNCTE